MYGGMPFNMTSNMYSLPPPSQSLELSKGKGKARDIDFAAAFAQVDQSLSAVEQTTASEQEASRFAEFDDTADLSEAMQRASVQEADGVPLGSDFKTYVSIFCIHLSQTNNP